MSDYILYVLFCFFTFVFVLFIEYLPARTPISINPGELLYCFAIRIMAIMTIRRKLKGTDKK